MIRYGIAGLATAAVASYSCIATTSLPNRHSVISPLTAFASGLQPTVSVEKDLENVNVGIVLNEGGRNVATQRRADDMFEQGTTPLLDYIKKAMSSSTLIRFGRTAATVISIAVDYKISLWRIEQNSEDYNSAQHECHSRSAEKLYKLCCTNGGIFIKVGQHLGSLDFLLPSEYVQTLKTLHSNAPKSPLSNVLQVVEEELGPDVMKTFETFESQPLGAASLAQVHKLTLADGRVLALKVQHKEVKNHATEDTLTMEVLVNVVSWLFPEFKFDWLIEETKKNLPVELNFLHEGKNCEKIGRILENFPYLKVPKIHWDLSTEKILAMEFCEGGKVDDMEYMKNNGISCNEVSVKLGQLYSEMIFKEGFIHCDPHPGNILVRKKLHNEAEIVLLDHGLYQTLSNDFRIKYCKLWQSLLEADVDAIQRNCEAMNVGEMYGLLACILSGRSWESVTGGIKHIPMSKQEAKDIQEEAVKYVPEIINVLSKIPREMILILKTNDLLRGIDSKLRTSDASNSFVIMSKCCISAILRHEIASSESVVELLGVYKSAVRDFLLIYMYQFYHSPFMLTMRKMFNVTYYRMIASTACK